VHLRRLSTLQAGTLWNARVKTEPRLRPCRERRNEAYVRSLRDDNQLVAQNRLSCHRGGSTVPSLTRFAKGIDLFAATIAQSFASQAQVVAVPGLLADHNKRRVPATIAALVLWTGLKVC
jgi:hypothetical protein